LRGGTFCRLLKTEHPTDHGSWSVAGRIPGGKTIERQKPDQCTSESMAKWKNREILFCQVRTTRKKCRGWEVHEGPAKGLMTQGGGGPLYQTPDFRKGQSKAPEWKVMDQQGRGPRSWHGLSKKPGPFHPLTRRARPSDRKKKKAGLRVDMHEAPRRKLSKKKKNGSTFTPRRRMLEGSQEGRRRGERTGRTLSDASHGGVRSSADFPTEESQWVGVEPLNFETRGQRSQSELHSSSKRRGEKRMPKQTGLCLDEGSHLPHGSKPFDLGQGNQAGKL